MIHNGLTGLTAQEDELVTHFKNYEAASVKYLLLPVALPILPALTKLGVTLVYSDAKADIYEMPDPRPFYSTASSSCTVTSTSTNVATVQCPNGGTTLVRTELMMAGWKASVNGHAVDIKTQSGVYQTVKVPEGTSTVTYSFVPPTRSTPCCSRSSRRSSSSSCGSTNGAPDCARANVSRSAYFELRHDLRRHCPHLHDGDVRARSTWPSLRHPLRARVRPLERLRLRERRLALWRRRGHLERDRRSSRRPTRVSPRAERSAVPNC